LGGDGFPRLVIRPSLVIPAKAGIQFFLLPLSRRPCESRDPFALLSRQRKNKARSWILAFAGMTNRKGRREPEFMRIRRILPLAGITADEKPENQKGN
jgi:hypothetical protein